LFFSSTRHLEAPSGTDRKEREFPKKISTCCEMRSVDCDELGEVGEIAVEPGDLELGGKFFFFLWESGGG
jgi:hypothetical protein